MMYSIEVNNLTRVFRSKREERSIIALDNVNLKIKQGEIFGLLGSNGAGKSTMIKILSTLLLPTNGNAYIHDHDILKDANEIRKIVNLVSGGETPGYGILTVKENLWFFSQLYGLSNKEAKERIDMLIKDMELEEYKDIRMHKLSTGYKQRLNLARGFINDPKVLFLDEPTLGLDILNAKHIRSYVKEWVKSKNDRTVLLTTHYMSEADEMCDRIALIFKGKIVACDTPKRLKDSVSSFTSAIIDVKSSYVSINSIDGVSIVQENYDGITRLKVLLEDQTYISKLLYLLNNYNILSVKISEPTLEDVYIKYAGMSLSNDKPS